LSETVSQLDTGIWNPFDAFQAVSTELAKYKSVTDVTDAALWLALDLTKSSVAFIGVTDDSGQPQRVISRAADPSDNLPQDEIERLFSAAAASKTPASTATFTEPRIPAFRSYCGQQLVAAGQVIGVMGVASSAGYSAAQQRTFAMLANQVASALVVAQLHERRQEMVGTLINLRADLDRLEKQKLINEERAKAAERVERAHEAAVAALLAVSRHAKSGHNLGDFYRRLTASIADLVGASKVLFWQANSDGTLSAIPGAHGVGDDLVARLNPIPCSSDRDDITSRVVFGDYIFRASLEDEPQGFAHVFDVLAVTNAIAVPWKAGDQRLGMVAAYDSQRPEGFSREDTWVLQKAGLAAGLVWQLKHAETDLKKTIDRLQKVDAARQMLLRNVSSAVDKARKHFAGELHDDALQRLTAAELKLQQIRDTEGRPSQVLDEMQHLLDQTEEALRRLLFEVRPPALEMPGGFDQAIRERIKMLHSLTGAEVEMDLQLPDDLTYELKAMVFRQVAEAVTNIEKHAAATLVRISLALEDGAIHGVIVDNGRGFVVAERDHLPGHLGLLAINERSLLAGGWSRVESEPGLGTTVEFSMPIG
jgi:signal transduction histidine kinase